MSIRAAVIIALIAALPAAQVFAQEQGRQATSTYDNRPFLCGALFRLLVEAHAADKDRQVYDHYRSRYDLSFGAAKSDVVTMGGDHDDAILKMQETIRSVRRLVTQKKPVIGNLLSSCERSMSVVRAPPGAGL